MRRLTLICAVFLSACATTPAALARVVPDPRSPAEICLVEAGSDRAARRACVGRFTEACIESDDANATTPGMVACARNEQLQWAALRDRYVALLRAQESATQRELLEAALIQHTRWAQTRCAYGASLYEGGSLARYQGASCMRDAEADLALELYARFDEF